MGLKTWFCRKLCRKEIAREAERVRLEQEEELTELKRRVARQTCPCRVKHAAAEKLAKLSSAGLVLLACHSLTPEQQERLDVFECRVHAVAAGVEPFIEPEEFVREVVLGRVNAAQALLASGITPADVVAIAKAWNACEPRLRAVTAEGS